MTERKFSENDPRMTDRAIKWYRQSGTHPEEIAVWLNGELPDRLNFTERELDALRAQLVSPNSNLQQLGSSLNNVTSTEARRLLKSASLRIFHYKKSSIP